MSLLGYIILFVAIGSVFSLVGGILLLLYKKIYRVTHILSSFAAGALLGAVFFEILPEGLHQADESIGNVNFYLFVLCGILTFYLLERVLHWQHTHEKEGSKEPVVPMIVIGDTIHNFVDGIAIAAAFLINIPLGIVTAFVVGAHEIPQEIGDFGVLLKKGLSRKRVLLINILSASVSFLGAILTFFLGLSFSNISVVFVAIAAGFFLYISLSNLIPEIHHENRKGFALAETAALIGGLLVTYIAITSLHSYLPDEHNSASENVHNEIEVQANGNRVNSEDFKPEEYLVPLKVDQDH